MRHQFSRMRTIANLLGIESAGPLGHLSAWLNDPRCIRISSAAALLCLVVGCNSDSAKAPPATPPPNIKATAETKPAQAPVGASDNLQPGTTDQKPPRPTGVTQEPSAEAPPATGQKKIANDQPSLPAKTLFDDWQKPAAVLVITGQQLGYIEPCGCTGLENQKGGLARRHTLLKQLADDKGWPVVPLDVGSQVRRLGKQSEIKFQRTAEGLRTMGYKAVTLGADDLRLSPGELLSGTNSADDQPSIFTGSNVALFARELQPTFMLVEIGEKKIGVVGVLGDSFVQKLRGDELVQRPAVEGLKEACEELKKFECDYYVLLAHATPDEARALAKEAAVFDLVAVSGGGGLPSGELESIEGVETRLLRVSHKGMHAAVIGLFEEEAAGRDDKPAELTERYKSVPLDATLEDSPQMLALLADYQKQLQAEGLEGLGLKPQPHLSGRRFVGSETCGECHAKAFAVWEKTPHAHALDSLVTPPNSRGDIARHFDPECLSCHVTGWEPQKFYPFESGYLSLEKTPHLKHNGCENCHGPGSAHVAAENGEGAPTEEQIAKLRDSMKLPIAGGIAEKKCRECHDEDNSPEFSHRGFAEYWKEVRHVGKD